MVSKSTGGGKGMLNVFFFTALYMYHISKHLQVSLEYEQSTLTHIYGMQQLKLQAFQIKFL